MNAADHAEVDSNGVSRIGRAIRQLLTLLCILLIRLYQLTLSPILHLLAPGSGCRFYPSCSSYALEAVRKHGPARGTWLAIKRIGKCHPWGGSGIDMVPETCSCTRADDPHHLTAKSISAQAGQPPADRHSSTQFQ